MDGKVLGAMGSQGMRNSIEGSWLDAWKQGSQGWVGAQGRPLTRSASEGAEGGRGEHTVLRQEASAQGLSETGTSSAASPSGLVLTERWERGYFRCVKSDECWRVPSASLGTHSSYWKLRCARPFGRS